MQTILLVSEDALSRNRILTRLQSAAYRVFEAANGTEATRVAAEVKDDIHLLIMDIEFNRGSGIAERIAGMRPAVQVLFISQLQSIPPSADSVHFAETGLHYSPDALVRKVHDMLGQTGS